MNNIITWLCLTEDLKEVSRLLDEIKKLEKVLKIKKGELLEIAKPKSD